MAPERPGGGGTLHVVATPIGNLGDVTTRAKEVLAGASAIYAEDTRQTRKLLDLLGIVPPPIASLHEHSRANAIESALERLRRGASVALVSDAGTPLVSDPGAPLVRAARAEGHRVVPVPGACAVVAAVSATALGDGTFRFFGFLPREGPERHAALAKVAGTDETAVIYEAPHRLAATLSALADAMPSRDAVIVRELTKLHEEQVAGTLAQLAGLAREWLGEIVLVLGPWDPAARTEAVDDATLDARIDALYTSGERAKRIADLLAAWSGRPRRELYARVVGRKP